MAFQNTQNFLKNLKGLTKDESQILVKIIQRGGVVTPSDVKEILKELKLSDTVSRPYTILESLENKQVVFQDSGSNSKNKIYRAIHPRELLNDLKSDIAKVDGEVGVLEQPIHIKSSEFDSRSESRILQSALEISSTTQSLLSAGFTGIGYFDEFFMQDNWLYDRLKDKLGDKNVKKSDANYILLHHEKKQSYFVLVIGETMSISGNNDKYFATHIQNESFFKFLKKRGG